MRWLFVLFFFGLQLSSVNERWKRRLEVVNDKVVYHAVKIDEEEQHEVDKLRKGDILVELKLSKHLSGVNAVLLSVEDVTIPASKRKIDEELKPESAKKEDSSDCAERNHLVWDERVQTLCEIYRIKINIKVTERHKLQQKQHKKVKEKKKKRWRVEAVAN